MQIQDSKSRGPYTRFIYAIKSDETKRKYVKRLELFLDYNKFAGKSIDEKANSFFKFSKEHNVDETNDIILNYMSHQIERAKRNEISNSTIRNFYKPIKLFCDMNNIIFNNKLITRGFPFGSESSNDRIPIRDEILEMLKYTDRRIKPIALTMLSSGIRVGTWEFLKWKHVIPIEREGVVIAAKLMVINTKVQNRSYFTFITPEAYYALKEWMDFRSNQGEKITGESWLMIDIWNTNRIGSNNPKKADADSIRMMFNRAWRVQNVRSETLDMNSKRRHEFKATHSFRKYFETHALSQMKLLNVKLLMDHDIGIDHSYFKPTEEQLLEDYLKVVDLLSISNEHGLEEQVNALRIEKSRIEELESKVKKLENLEKLYDQVQEFSVKKGEYDDVIYSVQDSGPVEYQRVRDQTLALFDAFPPKKKQKLNK